MRTTMIPDELAARLAKIAEETERPKSFYYNGKKR